MMNLESALHFQVDWFSRNIPTWEKYLAGFKGKSDLRFLEIGSFEGQSTAWLLRNILTHPTSTIVCIDTFQGNDEHKTMEVDTSRLEQTFRRNIKTVGAENRVKVLRGVSQIELRNLPIGAFDFAYIDGSHRADDVLTDAVLTYQVVKPGGIIIFDDYEWEMDPDPFNCPHEAIKAFLYLFQREIELIHKAEQVIIKKR